jgi:hypothetical protein
MALNTNIALGVQPIQQPNMLAQYGQMMALKAAQQETEGYEGVKSAIAGGMDATDPRMLQYGKRGIEAFKAAGEGRVKQQDALTKAFVNARESLSMVRTPEDLLAYTVSQFNDPLIGPRLKAQGLTPEAAAANLQKELSTSGFETVLKKSAMGLDGWFKDQTSRRNQDVSSGPAYGQLKLAQDKAARDQAELERVRSIVNSGVTPPATAPVTPMGGDARSSIFNPASTNVLANQVAPLTATQAPINSLLNPPAGQSGAAPVANRVDEIMQQLTLLSKEVSPGANQAMERLVKELNVINPDGNIQIGKDGVIRTINKRSGVARVVTGADGQPVMGQVTPVTKDIVDPTDPSGKRMITVEVNSYKAGTGLGPDGKQAPPAGVLGVANSQVPANYMRDPNNPQGVVPVPGSPADPNAAVPSGYRRTADGKGLEFVPGGPEDPKIKAQKTTDTLSARDLANREAKYPQATAALKGFEAKTTKFERDIDELIANEKGLNEITGFLAGRTDLSALSSEGRRALSLFNTITAKGGFSELQDMRNSSPTGGALGNVSDREGRQLIDAVGALSRTQDANDLRKSLGILKSDIQGAKERLNEAYEMTYEYKNKDRVPALPPGFKID